MNFIEKIFKREVDDSVHLQFQKFGRGEFRARALVEAKFSAGKYTIYTTSEFSNEFLMERIKNKKTKTIIFFIHLEHKFLDEFCQINGESCAGTR